MLPPLLLPPLELFWWAAAALRRVVDPVDVVGEGEDDDEDEEDDEELDEELPEVEELWADCVPIGGDMGELCSGLWLPSESSLCRELAGVRGRLKPCPPAERLALGSILMFSLDMRRLSLPSIVWWDLSRLWDAGERCVEPF